METKIFKYSDFDNEDMTIVDKYEDIYFEDYYYNDKTKKFYFDDGCDYKELYINFDRNKHAFVNMIDVDFNTVKVYYNVFKNVRGFD